jgi:DNA-directed RNA polymerase subunit RPC12/RpoP
MNMRTQLYCHACSGYFNVDFDESLNGNHVVNCPKCGHEHYRVIKDGVVTEDRWNSSGPVYYVTGYAYTTTATVYVNVGYANSGYVTGAWSNLASTTSNGY